MALQADVRKVISENVERQQRALLLEDEKLIIVMVGISELIFQHEFTQCMEQTARQSKRPEETAPKTEQKMQEVLREISKEKFDA